MRYLVSMTANALVGTQVSIEADSPEQAVAKALDIARAGDVHWFYSGSDDQSIEADTVTKL